MATFGSIYFLLKTNGLDLVKIGWSSNPEQRLSQIQTSAPFPVCLIAKLDGYPRTCEVAFHRMFADCHEHGEWYRLEGSLLEFLLSDRSHFVIDAAFYWVLTYLAHYFHNSVRILV